MFVKINLDLKKARVAGLRCDILILCVRVVFSSGLLKPLILCRFSVLLLPRSRKWITKNTLECKGRSMTLAYCLCCRADIYVLLSSSTKNTHVHSLAATPRLAELSKKLPRSNCVALIVHQTHAIMAVTCAECCSFWTVTTSVRLYKDSAAANHFRLCHSLEEWRTGTGFPLEISGWYWQNDPLNATWL